MKSTNITFESFLKHFLDVEPIMDPIYKNVKVSSFEKQLINTPEFQRLRTIKQLGFVNLVYPTAEHSRFVHSIGVCHVAKRLVSQINENLEREKRYKVWRNKGINNIEDFDNNPDNYKKKDLITKCESIIISAAALLHDLPHSPFSHEIESPNKNEKMGIPKHDDFDKNPVLFKYLFDCDHSKLASIIRIYNSFFWSLFNKETENIKWQNNIKDEEGKQIDYWYHSVDDAGNVKVKITNEENEEKLLFDENSPIIGTKSCEKKYRELPILGVMIFETLLFEKPKHWINNKENDPIKKIKKIQHRKIRTDWNKDTGFLFWRPLYGWFRPYRHDIIGNTICADLIDYIERDGKHTGIIASLDLKFLDRMTITRAPLFSDDNAANLNTKWGDIPETCEHVVFDIYDHKRGFIRESVITEILACLHARYQLAERVYEHRVVEGARSMLQEISRLLCEVDILEIRLLHSNGIHHLSNSNELNPPIGDETFLSWVIGLEKNIANITKNKNQNGVAQNIRQASALAKCIKDRMIYREAVILDGLHGHNEGASAGPRKICESLSDFLVSDNIVTIKTIEDWKKKISEILKENYNGEKDNIPDTLITMGIRKWGKRFKVPMVLVSKPYKENLDKNKQSLDIQPLFACEDPEHIKIQLDAMKIAYDGLWRVYLFIHPAFHSKEYEDLHKQISDEFLKFVKENTPIEWRNSINIKQLLPENPLDIFEFIRDSEREKNLGSFYKKFISVGTSQIKPESSKEIIRTVNDEEINEFIKELNPTAKVIDYLKYKNNQEKSIAVLNNHDEIKQLAANTRDGSKIREYLIYLLDQSLPENIQMHRKKPNSPQLKIDNLE